MIKIFTRTIIALFAVLATSIASAQSVADFYKGRDVKIVIGAGLGGSYGLYSQLIAKHIKNHIPGKPSVIVQSMPGAGGLKALNFTYNAAPKDGSVLTIAHAEVLFETLLGEKVRFNANNYNWIGRVVDVDFIIVASKASGIKSMDDAKKREVTAGATGLRSVTAIAPEMYNRFTGTKFKIVAGYKGTRRIFQAVEQGEADVVATSWVTAKSIHGAKLANGSLVPIGTIAAKRLKELPNIPTITEFARSDDEKLFLNIYATGGMIGRSLATPPEVPADRVAALRTAFQAMLKDPAFQAEVKERKVMYNPMSGEDLQANVAKFMKTPADKIAAAKAVFKSLLADIKK